MKKKENQMYEVPELKVLSVEMEQGIAATSATASPSPGVNDWTGGSGGNQNGDF